MAMGRIALIAAGAVSAALIGAGASVVHGPRMVARLDRAAQGALGRSGITGVRIDFTDNFGWLTRYPRLSGERLDDATRARAKTAVAEVPGIGVEDVMPLWLEIELSLLMTYSAAVGFGRLLWGRARRP